MKTTIAAFDFDCTISYRDSLIPFLWTSFSPWIFCSKLLRCAPYGFKYLIRSINNGELKRRVLSVFFKNLSKNELHHKAQNYAKNILPQNIRPEAMQRMQWHKKQGHLCIIVSASLELYLKPWAENAQFDEVLSTKLDFSSSPPKMLDNCYALQKVNRLKERFGENKNYILYAYGDSEGDKELLEYADYSYFRTFEEDKEQ